MGKHVRLRSRQLQTRAGKSWLTVALSLALVASLGCAANPTYVNANYFGRPSSSTPKVQDKPKLVVVPVMHEQSKLMDSIAQEIYSEHTGLDIVMPDSVRRALQGSPDFAFILDTVAHYKYVKEELKANPGLYSIVNDEAVAYVSNLFGDADLIYIPIAFAISQDIFATYGYTTYRLYDLNTGQMVFERTNHPNIALHGKLGFEFMALSLISWAGYDVQEFYSDKLGIEGPARYGSAK